MKRGVALLLHSMTRYRTLLLAMGGVLAGFQILFCIAAVTLQQSDSFGPLSALIPAPMREAMGPGLITMLSFTGIVCLGYFHIAIIGALIGMVIAVGTEPAAEIETRFIELVLSHPLPRYWIVLRTVILVTAATAFVVTAMVLGSAAGTLWFGPKEMLSPTLHLLRSLSVNLGVLMLAWGGVALALASVARRRGVPAAIAGVLALSSYLVDYLARVWNPAKRVTWLCPFHYYRPVDMIAGAGLSGHDLWILAAIAVGGFTFAVAVFNRRDI